MGAETAVETVETVEIGEKVDVHLGRGPSYRTMVEDMDQDNIWISTPFYRGIPIPMRQDQGAQLYYYRENGRFCLDVVVSGFKTSGEVRLIGLNVTHGPRRQQRRDSYRYSKSLEAIMRNWEAGPFPLKPDKLDLQEQYVLHTENISETGALLIAKREYEFEEQAYLRLYLNWPHGHETPPIDLPSTLLQKGS